MSHPVLDSAVTCCRSHGLYAKITGAGGGGCLVALLPSGLSG